MVNVAYLFLVVQFECFNLKTSIDVIVCMLSGSKTEIDGHNYVRTLVVELYQVLKTYKTAVLVHACWCVNTSKILANHVPECEFVMISWTFMTGWLLTSQILETAGNCSLKHKKNTFTEQATKSKLLRFILCDQMYKYIAVKAAARWFYMSKTHSFSATTALGHFVKWKETATKLDGYKSLKVIICK